MTHTYKISGMTCNGCVSSVKELLESDLAVVKADISLVKGEAEIQMTKHLSAKALQSILGENSKYQIREGGNPSGEEAIIADPEEEKSWIATYKPLLIIFFFLAGSNLIIELRDGQIDWMGWMNGFMAGFFLVFSFFKFLDLKGFAKSYQMYDLLAARIPVYGIIYPFLELGLGLAYLSGINPPLTYLATIVIMGFSSLGVIQSVLDKRKIRCACLGAVFNLPMSTVTIVEDLLMVAMAAVMWILY
ncbi:MAG: heavy-metal-associated domain-containing protein [Bacteroidetes bacterium]|nr:heavy-metal-associated domain-containing protein [Bacteroidota bacterium]